ncbi:MAG: type IV secretion system DNA-binding domain-containing protein [Desulfobacterales bacterium]|nr:type IV secretion system DNA-binding domain-containing protein [Desulfobacterales bacterium]
MNTKYTHEGYETFMNHSKMAVNMYIHLILFCMLMQLSFIGIEVYLSMTGYEIRVIFKWIFAKIMITLIPGMHLRFMNPDGSIIQTTAFTIAHAPNLNRFIHAHLDEFMTILLDSCLFYLFFPLFLMFFKYRALHQSAKKNIGGIKLIQPDELKKQMRKHHDTGDLCLGSVNMPINSENRHTFSIGRPGVGKTCLNMKILERLIERNERILIYDFKGDYCEAFYNPKRGHQIFNPLDARSLHWNIFNDIHTHMDIDAVASSLIPSQSSTLEPFWHDAARDVFSGILHFLYEHNFRTNQDIWKIVTSDRTVIEENLKGTQCGKRALRYLGEENAKQAQSILAVMMQFGKCFEYMAEMHGDFSIKRWLESDANCIFITSNADVQDTLRPILSLFIDLIGRKLLSMPDNYASKTFILLDEFGTLQRLTSIISLLTLSRSKNGSCFISIQDYGQIDETYSKNVRQTIINSCGTKVLFSVGDVDTANISSKLIGESEFVRMDKSVSMGVSDVKDGTSLSFNQKKELLLSASEIMNLPDLHCVVKFPNYNPVISTLTYKKFTKNGSAFQIREDLLLNKAYKPASQ